MDPNAQTTQNPLPAPPLTPPKPKELMLQRFKFLWRILLISNLALGAYIFSRPRKRDIIPEEKKPEVKIPSVLIATPPTLTDEELELLLSPPIRETVKERSPLSEDRQRELFQWILEEKRKVIPKDHEHKRQLDQEKDILKQFIHQKSIPSL